MADVGDEVAAYRFDFLHLLAVVLAVASAAVLAIGLLYVVMNAWWIVRASIRPAAPIDEFVDETKW